MQKALKIIQRQAMLASEQTESDEGTDSDSDSAEEAELK